MTFDEFINIFWGNGNVTYTPNDEKFKMNIVPWVEKLKKEQFPVVLPRYENKTYYFYSFYENEKEAELKEYLRDVLGVYTFINITAPGTVPDIIDNACMEFSNNKCLKFLGNKQSFEQLGRLMQILTNKPSVESVLLNRPIGQLISRFRQAVFQRNKSDISAVLTEIKKTNNFSWHNILYLEIQMHASLGEWYEICEMTDLQDLVRVKVRPKTVTQAIITALYNIKLASYVEKHDYDGLITAFAEKLFSVYRDLFEYRGELNAIETVNVFLLKQLCSKSPSSEEVTLLERLYPDNACVIELVRRCRESITPPAPGLSVFQQGLAFKNELNYDEAYRLFKQCDLTDEKVFFNMADIIVLSPNTIYEELVFLKGCFEGLTDNSKKELLKHKRAKMLVDVLFEKVQQREKIASWTDWAIKLRDEKEDFKKFIKIAQEESGDWDVEALNPGKFENVLEELLYDDARRPILREIAGGLVCSFVGGVNYRKDFTNIYKIIFETLICDDYNDPNTIFEVFGYILDSGLYKKDEYHKIVDELINIWESVKSPKTITLGLDALDLLLMYPDPSNKELPTKLFSSIFLEFSQPAARRIDQVNWEYFGELCTDFKYSEQFSKICPHTSEEVNARQESVKVYLKGKTIAIYTLLDNVRHKVIEVLNKKYPDTKIKVNGDSGNTPELENLARTADIFIFATGAAKHAAFYAVKNNRKEGLLYPRGKGVSGMIACLDEHLAKVV